MTPFNFSDELDEFPYVAACVARCTYPLNNDGKQSTDLLGRMKDHMTATEMVRYHRYYEQLTFSNK